MNALQWNTPTKLPWIVQGYALFAEQGPNALKVEVLGRLVGKNKSSFYHHFADLDFFVEHLLAYHLSRASLIADRETQCKNVIPELLETLLEFPTDLFFNRQLRIHRSRPDFAACFQQSSMEVGEAIIGIWAEALGLSGQNHLAQLVLSLTIENFYLQITPQTFTYEWLEAYVQNLQALTKGFLNANQKM
ncbi:MAG: TetR/AcrR family transcriptional regulator [Bacteroidota bacterium]